MLLMQQLIQSSLLITIARKPSAINRAIVLSHLGEPKARAQVEPVEAKTRYWVFFLPLFDSHQFFFSERVTADYSFFFFHF